MYIILLLWRETSEIFLCFVCKTLLRGRLKYRNEVPLKHESSLLPYLSPHILDGEGDRDSEVDVPT